MDVEFQPSPALAGLLDVLRAAVNGAVPAAPAEWPAVLNLARLHELDAYLYPHVRTWPVERRPPEALLAEWRRLFLARTADAVRVSAQLGELLAALRAEGVQAIPLKGAWLAERVYDDIACRPMQDLDVLIRPECAAAARRVLAALGYDARDAGEPGPWRRDLHFRHPERPRGVELQWQVWTPDADLLPAADMDRLWADAREEKIAGQSASALPPARHLLYLIYHLLRHHWRAPARAHLDMVLLGRRSAPELSMDLLDAEARAWGLAFRAPFVWRVAHDICGAAAPASSAGWAPADAAWCQKERSAALAAALPEEPLCVSVSASFAAFRSAPLGRRWRVAAEAVFRPADALRTAYPRATRRFGLAGGYTARLADLLRRRARDVLPAGRRGAAVDAAAADMAARLRLDRWLRAQEDRP